MNSSIVGFFWCHEREGETEVASLLATASVVTLQLQLKQSLGISAIRLPR